MALSLLLLFVTTASAVAVEGVTADVAELPPGEGGTCRRWKNCVWQCWRGAGGQTTTVVDLGKVGVKNGNARWQNVPALYDRFSYSYNPCYSFTPTDPGAWLNNCYNVVVCQKTPDTSFDLYDGGTQSTEHIYMEGDEIVVRYIGYPPTGPSARTSKVMLKCDEDATAGNADLQVLGEKSPGMPYEFILTTKEACFHPFYDEGLSTGSILTILLFTFAVVYVVGGVLFLKYRRQAEGSELVPNRMFWLALPGLVKDGTVFFAGKSKDAANAVWTKCSGLKRGTYGKI